MNRRKFLISGSSILALAAMPSAVAAVPVAPFVPPTTNVVHLAGRIAQKCLFSEDEVLHLLGLIPSKIVVEENPKPSWMEPYEANYYDRVDQARLLAEDGAHDIYERARLVIDLRRKLNEHFNYDSEDQLHWLNRPNSYLHGRTFREVMIVDLRLAAGVIDEALKV
jgi:hypothetical protein